MQVLYYFLIFFFLGILSGFLLFKYLKSYLKLEGQFCLWMGFGNGILDSVIFMKYSFSLESLIFCFFSSILLGILVIDWKLYQIPAKWNGIILVLGIFRFLVFRMSAWEYVLGPILMTACFFLLYHITRGMGLGGGDIKFIFAAGIFLGLERIFLAVFLAGILAIFVYLVKSWKGRGNEVIAFGPCLAIGSFLVLFLNV